MDSSRVYEEFFTGGKIWKSMNSTFITLVPKKDKSRKVYDFQAISLVTSIYKIFYLFF